MTELLKAVQTGNTIYICCACSITQSCPTLFNPRTVACQAPPSMGFFRQEYSSGLPFPPPGDLLDPGIKPTSPALDSLLLSLYIYADF